ncbi:MAG: glycine cleavage system protein H [Bacteroidota bacterium]
MDGFSYSDIFATKGIEYLVIIAFLVLLIPFAVVLNRQVKVTTQLKQALAFLSAGSLRIPQGLLFNKNHTWTHLEKSGAASLGLDDLLLHLTGEVNFSALKKPGETIRRGDPIAEIGHQGKLLRIDSPISGKILQTNPTLGDHPGLLNEDPYGRGWIYKIKPTNWIAETNSCVVADEATLWSTGELDRFKDFLAHTMHKYSPESPSVILQDGGELSDHALAALPAEMWRDFQDQFLTT